MVEGNCEIRRIIGTFVATKFWKVGGIMLMLWWMVRWLNKGVGAQPWLLVSIWKRWESWYWR
jgi:hypothetical protein